MTVNVRAKEIVRSACLLTGEVEVGSSQSQVSLTSKCFFLNSHRYLNNSSNAFTNLVQLFKQLKKKYMFPYQKVKV